MFPQLHRFLEYRVVGEATGNFLPPWSPRWRLLRQTLLQAGDLDFITKVKADFQDAISSATTALENHKAFADEVAAKLAKTVKKVAKK